MSPTIGRAYLAACGGKESCFTLGQHIERIVKEPSSVADLRVDRCARSAVADSEISLLVHRGTAHPTPGRVRLVGALLEDRHRSGSHVAQLEPAYSGHPARINAAVPHQCLVGDK